MKRLILVGAGSFGREIAEWLPMCIGFNTEWQLAGFLDNDEDRFGLNNRYISTVEEYQPGTQDIFLCTLPVPEHKMKYVNILTAKGGIFETIIANSAVVSVSAKLGKGLFIAPFCTISCDTTINDHTTFNTYAAVGHDVFIGSFCHINSFTLISGFCHLSSQVTVHPHCSLLPRKRIGERSVVGVGSVVIRSVERDTTVFGNPAKIISLGNVS